MICRIGAVVYCGRAISLPRTVDPAAVVAAVRANGDGAEQPATGRITVDCPPPQPVHEHVGYIHPEMGLRTRTALARAGRTLGLETSYDDDIAAAREELATVRSELDSTTGGDSDPSTGRRAGTAGGRTVTGEKIESLREEVSAARGRLQACRDHGLDTAAAEAKLEAAIRKLSEHETESTAATQREERARRRARERRDRLERKLRLEDRVANLERNARRSLVDQLREAFAAAIEGVPGAAPSGDPLSASPPVAALAIARLASLDAPVVLSTERFESAAAAHEVLGAPVVYL